MKIFLEINYCGGKKTAENKTSEIRVMIYRNIIRKNSADQSESDDTNAFRSERKNLFHNEFLFSLITKFNLAALLNDSKQMISPFE